MKILVIGSGGREHALVWKISQSPLVDKIYCAPGNPGISDLAENVPIKAFQLNDLLNFALHNHIDLTVVGPEDPLVEGIVDRFTNKSVKIFGPDSKAAQLEGSKAFAKSLMRKHKIPTAEYEIFDSYSKARNFIENMKEFPTVLKADGLAAGKGVLICQSREEAFNGISMLMENKVFGTAGDQIVIEEFLDGEEVSIFVLSDGTNYHLLSSSQDHKKVFDGDTGKNTGGMGAYAPAPVVDRNYMKKIETSIIQPSLEAMTKENSPYKGLLYFGLILTTQGPKVLEYNCRFGDPESEVVLPLLKSDLVPLLLATIDGSLNEYDIEIESGFAFDVVLASGGYPDAYKKGKVIYGLNNLDKEILVFHAGTAKKNGSIITNGGRVLNIVGLSDSFQKARDLVYSNVEKISFDRMHYRKDIGYRAAKYLNT
jgi:phosphoribosylamine--glycine ligase